VKLTPPSRRRPLQFTGAGQPRSVVTTFSTSAGPCDPVSDSFNKSKTKDGVDYFFLRAFFAFDLPLAFAFLFFAIAALLA
jgi:hypothetical protein